MILPSCSTRGVAGDVPRTEQRRGRGRRCGLVVSPGPVGKPIGLMRRPRAGLVTSPPGGPGQPSAGITTGCLEWLHVATMTERWPPFPNTEPETALVVARKHGPRGQKRRKWSAGRRTPPIARRNGTLRKTSHPGGFADHPSGASQAPASAGAPLPSLGREELQCATRACPGPTKQHGRWRMPARHSGARAQKRVHARLRRARGAPE